MVSGHNFEQTDRILGIKTGNRNYFFGGIKVIVIGNFG